MMGTYRKTAGALLLIGAAQFAAAMIAAESVHPRYSVANNYISDLGVGPAALIFNASVFLLGATAVLSAYLIFHAFRNCRLMVALLALAGAGVMGVGVFTETAGYIHWVVSAMSFLFGGLSAISSCTVEKPPLNYLSVAMGVFSLVAAALYGSHQYLGLGHGGMERMIAYPTLLWCIAFGGHLISYSEKP